MLLATETSCEHCGLPTAYGVRFCCAGCESVHALLAERGLTHFYELRDQYSFEKPKAVAVGQSVSNLDEELGAEARFYLEGIHCLGCLWLLEKLPELDARILSTQLDIAHQILTVKIRAGEIAWTEVLQLIGRLGYTATPIGNTNGEAARRQSLRLDLLRIGVAAFSAGNIMLLSVSIYGGTDQFWGMRFGWLSLVLAIPALTFSAWPIYKSALYPLRERRISVDLAIGLALLAGVAMSVWSLVNGSASQIYFDSLTMLVFLLQSSRYLLSRFRESLAQEKTFLSFLRTERYQRVAPVSGEAKAEDLMPGDELALAGGQTLPVDSTLLQAPAHFDFSLLTGEAEPVKLLAGDRVEAGARLKGDRALLRVEYPAAESRLAVIMDRIRAYQLSRSPSLDFANRMGRYFVVVVLALASAMLALRPDAEGLRRALALVIVTCPCVLAFAVPLALTRAMQLAARRGILFTSADKLEALSAVDKIFFDKTGTLTTGQFAVQSWEQLAGAEAEAKNAVAALESRSSHPVAKAIFRYTGGSSNIAHGFASLPGRGASGWVGGRYWQVLRAAEAVPGQNTVEVFAGEELQARVTLGDAIRPEAPRVLRRLHLLGISPSILSGDHAANAEAVARTLGISSWNASLLPEAKAEIVAKIPNAAMVGDGANDAIAFQGASVGIAVQGAVDLSLKNADVVLTRPGLESLVEAIELARSSLRLVRLNFAITLAYNTIAGALAIAGLMQPLWAAILMPLSALSVFLLTQWQTWRIA